MEAASQNPSNSTALAGRKTISYETTRSDTLQAVALKFNMSTTELMRINKLRTSSVFPGQQLLVYEPLRRSASASEPLSIRPTQSQPIAVPSADSAAPQMSASPPTPHQTQKLSPDSDLAYSTMYVVESRTRTSNKSGITRHHEPRSLPLLSRLRHDRDRKYFFETVGGDEMFATAQRSYLLSGTSPSSELLSPIFQPFGSTAQLQGPSSQRRTSFVAAIPDEYRITERDILKEHVRYFISEQKNLLGELTITPSKVIFEPELDDPMTRELGLMRSHFQCDMVNIIDVNSLDAAEVVAGWRSKLTRVEGDFALPGSPRSVHHHHNHHSDPHGDHYERAIDFSGVDLGASDTRPRFLQLTVMASSTADPRTADTGRIVYFLVNRVGADAINRRLHEWMHKARTSLQETQQEKSEKKHGSSHLHHSHSVPSTAARRNSTSAASPPAAPLPIARSRISLDILPSALHEKDSRLLSTSAPSVSDFEWARVPAKKHSHSADSDDDDDDPIKKKFIGPTLKDISVILQTPEIQKKLASILPPRYQNCNWSLLYSTARHGVSLTTFFMKTRGKGPTVMVVEDQEGYVFGGFASEGWEPRKGFYGTGESLLFTLFPAFNVYPWSGLNDYFMFAREDQIAIGGGGGKFGLWLDSEFLQGASAPCDTFLNSCLASQEYFQCTVMECWGFDDAS